MTFRGVLVPRLQPVRGDWRRLGFEIYSTSHRSSDYPCRESTACKNFQLRLQGPAALRDCLESGCGTGRPLPPPTLSWGFINVASQHGSCVSELACYRHVTTGNKMTWYHALRSNG